MKNDSHHAFLYRISVRFFSAHDERRFLWKHKVIILSQGLIVCEGSNGKALALWMSVAEALQITHIIRLSPKPGKGSCSRLCEHSSWVAIQRYLEKGTEEERKRFYGSVLYIYLLYLVVFFWWLTYFWLSFLYDSFGPQNNHGQPTQILTPFVPHEPNVPVELPVYLQPR